MVDCLFVVVIVKNDDERVTPSFLFFSRAFCPPNFVRPKKNDYCDRITSMMSTKTVPLGSRENTLSCMTTKPNLI